MGILLFTILVIVLIALGVWAVSLLPIPSPANRILQALVIVIGLLAIADRAGVV